MYLISITSNETGSRPPIESWNRDFVPEGFVLCPESMISAFTVARGFVNVEAENDIVISMTENTVAKEAWEAANPPITPDPYPEEDRDTMLVDLDYRMTLIELGVN